MVEVQISIDPTKSSVLASTSLEGHLLHILTCCKVNHIPDIMLHKVINYFLILFNYISTTPKNVYNKSCSTC
jgi:hypothetical protein